MSMQNGGTTTMDASSKRANLRKGVDASAYPLPFKHGGKIYIKPENRGKFNATKAKTGKSTEELTHSSNPVTKKRAVFAQNAAKWHHAAGGTIGGPNPTKSPWQAVDDIPSTRPGFRTKIFKNTTAVAEPDYTSPVTREEFMKNTGAFTKPNLDFPLNQARTAFEGNPNMRSVTLGRERQVATGESLGVNPPYPLLSKMEDFRDLNPMVGSPQPYKLPAVSPFKPAAPATPEKMKTALDHSMAYKPAKVNHTPEGYDYKRGLPASGSITRREDGGTLGTGSTFNKPMGKNFKPVTAFAGGGTINRSPSIMPSQPRDMSEALIKASQKMSDGGSIHPTSAQELNPAGASSGMSGVPPGGIQPPILMYNTHANGLNEAVAAALRRVTPLPQASKGMKMYRKMGNGSFGDKTASPVFGAKTGLTIKK